jgi:hypothetical protein
MTSAILNPVSLSRNEGDNKEFSVCAYVGAERTKHDSKDFRTSSDIVVGDRHISVKSSAFTLMSGNMCEGETTFDGIWNVYADNTHSNEFVYVAQNFIAYFMNLAEFKKFVYAFCRVERESEKNGGAMKIRCRKESKKMIEWLNACVA